jgi:hypothetical protein
MTVEERKRITQKFLEELDAQGFIGQINPKLLYEDYTKNFPIMLDGFGNTFNLIIDQYDSGKTNFGVSDSDMTIFVCFCGVSLVNAFLEFIKKMLVILILKDKTKSETFLTYGTLIGMLSDKLGYDNSKRKTLRENFYVAYRNAISHIDYYVTGEGIFFKIEHRSHHYNLDEFNDLIFEIKAVADTIMSFVNNKANDLEKKAIELENHANDLTQQAEYLKKMVRSQREKTADIKHETEKIIHATKRKERERDKIYKNTKLLERAKKKDSRNNARIVTRENRFRSETCSDKIN